MILYTYINRHGRTPNKDKRHNDMIVAITIKGIYNSLDVKDLKITTWYRP